ncbi:MAG TPA: general secretion pathway protein GspE [Planctomycetaceae bacterium]|nr:general secretion pathway protein GspE [Planctomycetaceae bacterium]
MSPPDSIANSVEPTALFGAVAVTDQTQAEDLGLDFIDLSDFAGNRKLIERFPASVLFRHFAFPLEETASGDIRVAICNAFDLECINELSVLSGKAIVAVLADRRQIEAKLVENLGVAGGTVGHLASRQVSGEIADASSEDLDRDEEASVLRVVNELLREALEQSASDIHIEPTADNLRVRFRVDGQLRQQPMPEGLGRFRAAIASRLKIMAKLNIAEKRLPQDGRIELSVRGRAIDVRISVIPVLHGESIVMRILDQSKAGLSLDEMQMPFSVLGRWRKLIRQPHGLLLVTGPTGSGKTTTLYGSLKDIRDDCQKIITIEDPIEYQLDGVSQIQVQPKIGLSFPQGLRSILRHDPDAVLIGEIRDAETAVSAVQAALTGHLVFSTLHTNDAASAITRLVDMEIEPYLVASTVSAVLAQRLVRKLCEQCKTPAAQDSVSQHLEPLQDQLPAGTTIYTGTGCKHCHGTGFSGRVAVTELLELNNHIRSLCTAGADSHQIRLAAQRAGMVTLRESGMRLVADGVTSLSEILRITADEPEAEIHNSFPTKLEGGQ